MELTDVLIEKIRKLGNLTLTLAAERWRGEDLKKPSKEAKADLAFMVIASMLVI